jgi:hypothetical protein
MRPLVSRIDHASIRSEVATEISSRCLLLTPQLIQGMLRICEGAVLDDYFWETHHKNRMHSVVTNHLAE